jgi:hypothetical protein
MLSSLDFIYMPSRDVARDLAFCEDVLGGEIVFAVERFGTRVARVQVGEGPALLFAAHLEGEAPVLVHRVASLDQAIGELERAGVQVTGPFGIPYGDCAEFRAPGGARIGIYELTRPEIDERLRGRRDFEPER